MTSSNKTDLDPQAIEALYGKVGANIEGAHDGRGMRIGIICARFNGGISQRLLDGAFDAAERLGVESADISVAWVPGAFEIPLVARAFALTGNYDATIGFGAVIRGETSHYDFVAGECARGLQDVGLATGVPTIFGVLTTENVEQALDRCRPDGSNKGAEALETAVELVQVLRASALSS
jgi:6,7-dimethyl-8-ribityllumazine synthase